MSIKTPVTYTEGECQITINYRISICRVVRMFLRV
jgi:hypothetical protein